MTVRASDIVERLREYNKSLSRLTKMEQRFVDGATERSYIVSFGYIDAVIPDTLDELFKEQKQFKGLLRENNTKLCEYLKHIQEFTCNTRYIRMDIRSSKLSNYKERITHAIGVFYVFYGAGLSLKELIYGGYREALTYLNMAPVIAAEIMQHNEEAIQYCKNVLTSENNTAILTRDVIVAIEQSDNTELHDLLIGLLRAAKLQEGLRQSILETADEYRTDFFYRIIDVINEEKLLRYSSAQRAVQTWIGIGYENVEPRHIEMIFSAVCECIRDESKLAEGLEDENPMKVYIALYCIGMTSLEKAVDKAVGLLAGERQHIIAAALIYLKLTMRFPIIEYRYLLSKYSDDEWIKALYLSECVRCDVKNSAFSEQECHKTFDEVYPVMTKLKTSQTYSSKGFEWFSVTLNREYIVDFLAKLLVKAPEKSRTELLLPYVPSLWTRSLENFLKECFPYASLPAKKKFMIKEIISHQRELCNFVTEELLKTPLDENDIEALEGRLKTKKAYARAAIIKVLAGQTGERVRETFERLYSSNDKLIQESALELQRLAPSYFEDVHEPEIKIEGREEGFGLYERYQKYSLPYQSRLGVQKKGIFKKKESVDLSFINAWDKQKIIKYFTLWNSRIEEHAEEQYSRAGRDFLVGDRTFFPIRYSLRSLDALPLGDVWREYFKQDKLEKDVIFQLHFVLNSIGYDYDKLFEKDVRLTYLTPDDAARWEYYHHFETIIEYYFYECDTDRAYLSSYAQTVELFLKHVRGNSYKKSNAKNETTSFSVADIPVLSIMVNGMKANEMDDEMFAEYFPLIYNCYLYFNVDCAPDVRNKFTIRPLTAARACCLGLLPQTALMEMILDDHTSERKFDEYYYYYNSDDMLREAYQAAYFENRWINGKPRLELPKENTEIYSYLRETLDKISDKLITMETSRLNDTSSITKYVQKLYVVRGMKYLLIALKMLENGEIKKNQYENDKQTVFANIIRKCYPMPGDSPEELKKAGIPEKRLAEVAMMAPQWIDLVNEVLEWDGFKEACYYFIAHTKQDSSELKKAEIAHYTELDPEDLNDGAFDIAWCRAIYQKLGEKRVKLLYDASKLLCENSFHTRARKYLDACVGKKSKEEFFKQASEKRNKDALNAYCIAPLKDEADLMERYMYVQQFLKESKKFGAQRRASEKRCCEIALMNLAANAGFDNVDRMIWKLESMMADEYKDVFELKTVDEDNDIRICLETDDDGRSSIVVYKNGKKLKSVPARLKNDEHVIRVKEAHDILKKQYQRIRSMLERAMEERTEFGCEEIASMSNNVTAGPMLRKLVLISNGFAGFYNDGYLVMGDKKEKCIGGVRLAHALDLYRDDTLQEFQQYIFENRIVQPFKQVFRELYLKLDDDMERQYTKRYSGYQIQAKQAAGALKSRGWNVSYESGLEKVFYRQDVVVDLMADADWFSPADIEAPSIDYVGFSHRRTDDKLLIKDIDDVLFSETMRDVDMAVSVAFVGGVDPVTSMSSIELRRSIVECTCRLMKLINVHIEGNFAHISGNYNDYSVHLGSGEVHQKAGSAIHMIPVWSGQRGKVYLPFLDEDPVTAQIVSKVVMLADDTSIKDPSILSQIRMKN